MKETAFKEKDPFNDHVVQGIIVSTQEDDVTTRVYGDIRIQKIDDIVCPQYINCTPKFYYPGNTTSIDKIPLKFGLNRVNIYDKIDGSNILAYHYKDQNGKDCVSFKTRKRPFLSNGRFAPFLTLWNEMLKRKGTYIWNIINNAPDYNIAFELSGYLNKVLIEYKYDIDATLLYGIQQANGLITDPINLDPAIKPYLQFDYVSDVAYRSLMEKVDNLYKKNKDIEGYMLYCLEGIFKCKSPTIVSDQSKHGTKFISYQDAYTTAINGLEEIDDINELKDKTIELLKETYDPILIEISMSNIDAAIEDITHGIKIAEEVKDIYEQCPFKVKTKDEFLSSKRQIMPWVCSRYRGRSTDVYNSILKLFL